MIEYHQRRATEAIGMAAQLSFGAVILALLTSVCFKLNFSLATAGFAYLTFVALFSLVCRLVVTTALSLVAVACLNYFFASPVLQVHVYNPEDILALVAFLTTSFIVTNLVARALRLKDLALRNEEKIREAERELRVVVDTIPAAVWSMHPNGSAEFHNRRWLEYTGLSPREAQGRGYRATVHPDDLARQQGMEATRLARGEPFEDELRLRRSDGEYRWFLNRVAPLRNELGSLVKWYGASSDIEDRKRAEEGLREKARLLDLTHDTVFVRDMNDVITYWNRGAEELYGWTSDQATGNVTHELLQTTFPEPLDAVTQKLLCTGRWEGELVHTKRDGTRVAVASRWALQRNGSGSPIAILETNNDITEHKRAAEALRDMQVELAHVNRVTTMGQLTASIAHEVNQPLAAVVTHAHAALRWLDGERPNLEEARLALKHIIKDGNRASEVVNRIRALIKKAPPRNDPLNMNEVILETVALARSEILKNGISLKTQLAKGMPLVRGDRVQLQQVLLNLIINALEAMSGIEGTRELLISTAEGETGYVRVAVCDSGPGLDLHALRRVFDAFYTTKPGGMGMGLSICHSIVGAHRGEIWATADRPQGAAFQFTLPGAEPSVQSCREALPSDLNDAAKSSS